jgi:Fe-S cluster assembly protein SufD
MNSAISAPEEMNRINADDAALIVTGGPASSENHEFAGWFRELQFEGWEKFESLPMPARTDEKWRFATVKAIDISSFTKPLPVSDSARRELIDRSSGLAQSAGRMIFANDQLLEREVLSDDLKRKGVIWEPIEKAVVAHEDIFRKHFMTQEVVLGSKKFAELHKSQVKSGTFLYVPPGVEIDLPIEVFHWLHGDGGSTFPHTLLIAGDNSKVTLVDYFESADAAASGFACGVNDLYLGAGAKLTYVCAQNWSRNTLAFQVNSTVVGRDASAMSMNLNLGGSYARTESVSRLVGEGGRSDMLAVSVAENGQEFDQRTLQDHKVPQTASDLLYKNSLSDTARTIFAGLIKVEPHAHKTDAYQKVRNLLLSDEAEANSMPGLEILADDVRCTHGATSGQIDEEELFYLQSRGISKKAAQQLIVFGFLNEVIERVGNEAVGGKLRALVQSKFDMHKSKTG